VWSGVRSGVVRAPASREIMSNWWACWSPMAVPRGRLLKISGSGLVETLECLCGLVEESCAFGVGSAVVGLEGADAGGLVRRASGW
jgi:hypothetical protein